MRVLRSHPAGVLAVTDVPRTEPRTEAGRAGTQRHEPLPRPEGNKRAVSPAFAPNERVPARSALSAVVPLEQLLR